MTAPISFAYLRPQRTQVDTRSQGCQSSLFTVVKRRRAPKNADEIADALSNFQNELLHFLSDDEATVSVATDSVKREKNSIIAFVATSLSEKITDEAVAKCLTGLDLYGDKLPKA